ATETVTNYYDDKLRLLRQANLSEDNIVGQLTAGIPKFYQGYLHTGLPTNHVTWLKIAQRLEITYPRQKPQDIRQRTDGRSMFTNRNNNRYNQDKKPPSKCK